MNAVLQTPRLALRWLDFADAPLILELLNTPGWLRWIGDRQVHTLEDARNYLRHGPMATRAKHGFGLLRVGLKIDDSAIGLCGLLQRDYLDAPDIGFAYLPEHAGVGYAQEAASAVLQWAVQLGHPRILAITDPGNTGSIRLLERIGLCRLGLRPPNENNQQLLLLGNGGDRQCFVVIE